MTTIMPEGEQLRRAIKWIAEMRAEKSSNLTNQALIQQASLKFNLSPLEADYLIRFMQNKET